MFVWQKIAQRVEKMARTCSCVHRFLQDSDKNKNYLNAITTGLLVKISVVCTVCLLLVFVSTGDCKQSPVPKICTWWHQHAGRDHELLRCCKPMNGGADPNSIKEVGARSKWNNYHQTERHGAARISLWNIVIFQKSTFQGILLERPAVE